MDYHTTKNKNKMKKLFIILIFTALISCERDNLKPCPRSFIDFNGKVAISKADGSRCGFKYSYYGYLYTPQPDSQKIKVIYLTDIKNDIKTMLYIPDPGSKLSDDATVTNF